MATDLGNADCVPCSATGFRGHLTHTQVQLHSLPPTGTHRHPSKIHPKLQALKSPKAWLFPGPCVQNHASTNTIPPPRVRLVPGTSWGLSALWNYLLPQAGQFSKQTFQTWVSMYWAKALNGIPPGMFSCVFASSITFLTFWFYIWHHHFPHQPSTTEDWI